MFETIRNAWKVAEIRKKLLFTLLIIIIFRFGSALTVPFLELSKVDMNIESPSETIAVI